MPRFCRPYSEPEVRVLLRTSEGRPSPFPRARARVVDGELQPTRAAHARSRHLELRGELQQAEAIAARRKKSSFRRAADMVRAATHVLNSAAGQSALAELEAAPAGSRVVIRCDVPGVFDLLVSDRAGNRSDRTAAAQTQAGRTKTPCCMVVDSYERDHHVLVHTFYAVAD